eukprot:scaffold38355_cov48-Attheya_sp.AAC.1
MADDATAVKGKKRGRPIKSPEAVLPARCSKRTKIHAMMPLEDASIATGPVDDSCDASKLYLPHLYIMKNKDFNRFSTSLDFRHVSDNDLLKLFPLRPGKRTSLLPPASFRINGRKIREFQEYSLQRKEELIVAEIADENRAEVMDAVMTGTSMDAAVDMGENGTEEMNADENGTEEMNADENGTEEMNADENGTEEMDADENGTETMDADDNGTEKMDADENGSEDTDADEN